MKKILGLKTSSVRKFLKALLYFKLIINFLMNFGLFIICEGFVLFHGFFSFGAIFLFLNFAINTQSRSWTHRTLFHHLMLSFQRLKSGIKNQQLNPEKKLLKFSYIIKNFLTFLSQKFEDSEFVRVRFSFFLRSSISFSCSATFSNCSENPSSNSDRW